MNIHEYQAKKLLDKYGIPIPPGLVALSGEEAREHTFSLGGTAWVVKAQVHAGGRGKAGGVKKVSSPDEVAAIAQQLIGSRLVTHQTGAKGQPISSVLIELATEIKKELYLSFVVDRSRQRIAIIASTQGGMDIEEVAAKTPEKMVSCTIDPVVGLQDYQSRQIAFALGLNANQRKELGTILAGLYSLFLERDLSLVEINPLIVNQEDKLMALDAKINVDDNALYRQVDLAKWYDASQVDEKEDRAKQFDLNYIALDGNIACMVNGAGLAMATMDVIKMYGGQPANFLDVGGGTTAERVTEAFKIIVSDKNVQAILVNIFGGIVRCDLIAQGVIHAVKETGTKLPVVVRLEGTNVEAGKSLLRDSGLSVIPADHLDDAAKKAVQVVNR